MSDSNFTIKVGSGTYNFLDRIYNRFIINSLTKHNEDIIERFITYDVIMNELIALGKIHYFEEVKYRLTGGEEPNEVMLSIMNKDNEIKTALWGLRRKVEEYVEEDMINRYY